MEMERTIWLISKYALEAQTIQEILEKEDCKYIVTAQGVNATWEGLGAQLRTKLSQYTKVYCLGIKGALPPNAKSICEYTNEEIDIAKNVALLNELSAVLEEEKQKKREIQEKGLSNIVPDELDNTTIWLISKEAVGAEIIHETLRKKGLSYLITEQGSDACWDNLNESLKNQLKRCEKIYCLGIKGKLPSNAESVVSYSKDEKDISETIELLKKINIVIDTEIKKREEVTTMVEQDDLSDKTVWLISKYALEAETIQESLKRHDLEYIVTNQGINATWEGLSDTTKNKLSACEKVYCIGIKGILPENVESIATYSNDEQDIEQTIALLNNLNEVIEQEVKKREERESDMQDDKVDEDASDESIWVVSTGAVESETIQDMLTKKNIDFFLSEQPEKATWLGLGEELRARLSKYSKIYCVGFTGMLPKRVVNLNTFSEKGNDIGEVIELLKKIRTIIEEESPSVEEEVVPETQEEVPLKKTLQTSIWLISAQALEAETVEELLRRKGATYVVVDAGVNATWDALEEKQQKRLATYDVIYCVGVKGSLPENAQSVATYTKEEDTINKKVKLLTEVTSILDSEIKMKKEKVTKGHYQAALEEDDEVEETVAKVVEQEEREENEITSYLNMSNIDSVLGRVVITRTGFEIEDRADGNYVDNVYEKYYEYGVVWEKSGKRQVIIQNGDEDCKTEWEQPHKVQDYELSYEEKVILLICNGDYEEYIEYNIIDGPIPAIPEVIEELRMAKKDLELFNIELSGSEAKLSNLQDILNAQEAIVEEKEAEIEALKAKEIPLKPSDGRGKQKEHQRYEQKLLEKQAEYSLLLEIQNEKEKAVDTQSLFIEQLTEIASLAANIKSRIHQYERIYMQVKKQEM